MLEPPIVSIIIPFRDKMQLTNDCLRTLHAALTEDELARVEVLLINNRSRPEELAQLKLPQGLLGRRLDADIEFNFQKLINFGAAAASAQVLLLLNNDIVFPLESRGFITDCVRSALKPEVGAVGPLLLYEDGTIQHAGVVVGFNDYADHLYRGWTKEQAEAFPFSAPQQDRWVSAVTAAFLFVEAAKFKSVGGMDERFIVCGGDVDLCLRLDAQGYRNLYRGSWSFYHLESKSRAGSSIPASDFSESRRSYGAFLQRYGGRDPYYPKPLPMNPKPPLRTGAALLGVNLPQGSLWRWRWQTKVKHPLQERLVRLRRFLRDLKNRMEFEPIEVIVAAKVAKLWRRRLSKNAGKEIIIAQGRAESLVLSYMRAASPCIEPAVNPRPRLNLILPHYNDHGVFAGIVTACVLACSAALRHGADLRFIVVDDEFKQAAMRRDLRAFLGSKIDDLNFQLLDISDRGQSGGSGVVSSHERDIFITTAWWTCYQARDILGGRPFVYLIQDYECGFYPWGDWYAYALGSYGMNFIPIFNTIWLRDFFAQRGLVSAEQIKAGTYFQPALNRRLYGRERRKRQPTEKRRLFFYGRPSVARNLFPIGIQALARAVEDGVLPPDQWEFVTGGEPHAPLTLADKAILRPLGKMPLETYAELLTSTDIGLSLMLSPHPSYPPLEIAASGAIAITNTFEGKDLSSLASNIISCPPTLDGVYNALKLAVARLAQEELTKPEDLKLPGSWEEALSEPVEKLGAWLKSGLPVIVS